MRSTIYSTIDRITLSTIDAVTVERVHHIGWVEVRVVVFAGTQRYSVWEEEVHSVPFRKDQYMNPQVERATEEARNVRRAIYKRIRDAKQRV